MLKVEGSSLGRGDRDTHFSIVFIRLVLVLWQLNADGAGGSSSSIGSVYHSSYSDLQRAGRFRDRIHVGDENLLTRPDRSWGPPSLSLVSFLRVKWPVLGVDHPPHLASRLKK